MRRLMMVAACWAVALSVSATEEWRFEVAADAPKVVSCPVDASWAKRMATQAVVAVAEGVDAGKILRLAEDAAGCAVVDYCPCHARTQAQPYERG